MKKLILAASAVLGLATPSMAADMPLKAPPATAIAAVYNWTGFYIGGHVGYGWGRSTLADIDNFCLGISNCPNPPDRYNFDGIVGGGQAGYNWQTGNLVFGVEVDFSVSGIDEKTPLIRTTLTLATKIDWFGTARLRLGYAADRALFYVTGGLAYANVANSFLDVGCGVPCFLKSSDVKFGWTVGGGLEYAFAPNWSVRAEYLFVDLEKNKKLDVSCAPACRFEWENRLNVARVGLNYKFGGPVVARY